MKNSNSTAFLKSFAPRKFISGPDFRFAPAKAIGRLSSRRPPLRLLAALFACFSIVLACNASTLIINRQITHIEHTFYPPEPMFSQPGYVVDELVFDLAGLTNVNLSAYDSFAIRLFGPDGQVISVNRNTNYFSSANIDYIADGDRLKAE